jgi:Ser/Thr protein kinase RdoA (MazF antagonist)
MIIDFIGALHTFISDEVTETRLMYGSQNKVYLLKTINGSYIVKQYSKDAISNEDDLNTRREQIRISKIWNENGINCVLPLTDIFMYNGKYYIIYPFVNGKTFDEGQLVKDQLLLLAQLQAKIHNLDIKTSLKHHINRINYSDDKLDYIINKNNEYLSVAHSKNKVCHNDFKPLNILWVDNKPILVDMDAVGLNHPTYSLLESAFTFTHIDNDIDMDLYKLYIDEYKKYYTGLLEDFECAVYGCWNGKLQWLDYLKNNKPDDVGITNLTNQMVNYKDYIDEIMKIK